MSTQPVEWEVYCDDGHWACLSSEACKMIELGKQQARRAILITDEKGLPARAFLDEFEEGLEAIGGTNHIRSLRRRCFPKIVLPSEIMPKPKEIKRRTTGKTRELSVTESYSRARIRIMHGSEKEVSASDLVTAANLTAKKKKAAKRKKQRDVAVRSASSRQNVTAVAKSEFAILEEDDNFGLSASNTVDLPKKPSLGWVLRGAFFPLKKEKEKEVEIETRVVVKKRDDKFNAVAGERLRRTVLWARARNRAKTHRGRQGAVRIILKSYRSYKDRIRKQEAAILIQQWVRKQALRGALKKAFKRAIRRKLKREKEAYEAELAARWTDAQKGVLVALEVAYGAPKHRGDWGLRSSFIGGEGTQGEKALGAMIEGNPKGMKDIQVKWEEMHASGALDDLDLLVHVPPAVLDTILPPWSSKRTNRDKPHRRSRRRTKNKEKDQQKDHGPPSPPALSGEIPKFRGEISKEFRSVAARFMKT